MKHNNYIYRILGLLVALPLLAMIGKAQSRFVSYTDANFIAEVTPYIAKAATSTTTAIDNQVAITYYDGLGRPLQQVAAYTSPDSKDLVIPIPYDALGRQYRSYLPYERNDAAKGYLTPIATATSDQATFYRNLHWLDSHFYAFTQTRFEKSALSRVVEQSAPGYDWRLGGGHTDTISYNNNRGMEIRLWKNNDGMPAHQGSYYPARTLFVTETKDSDRKQRVVEFKDMQDRLVEVQQISASNFNNKLVTSYVYDDFGYLRAVIPPKAQELAPGSNAFNALIYRYVYDHRGRLIEKYLPDAKVVYYVYDKADRLVMQQDGNMRNRTDGRQWMMILYDRFNRTVGQGMLSCTATHSTLQATFKDVLVNQTREGAAYTHNTIASIPALDANGVLSYTFYDHYDSLWARDINQFFDIPVIMTQVDGLVTGGKVKVLDGSEHADAAKWLKSATYYDSKHRVVQVISDLYDGAGNGKSIISSKLTFDGLPEQIKEEQTFSGQITTITQRYEYDHARRPLCHYQKLNDQAEVLLAKTTYDELGRASTKTLGGVEMVSYNYNIRSWMTKIASANFTTDIYYNSGAAIPQWNGNIAATKSDNQTYSYRYDAFNRLAGGERTDGYKEHNLSYDSNGNITALTRLGGGNTAAYTYSYKGNKLTTLKKNGVGKAYTYDANGNTTTDGLREVNISYNYLNLPKEISKGSDKLRYVYDAAGNKLAKQLNGATTQYYAGSVMYKGDKTPDYVLHAEGMAVKTGNTFDYQYNLTDHLGNVRAAINSSGGVEQKTDYYPFGLAHSYGNLTKNKYLYNGKELQDELGLMQYDYGARFYNPEIGIWGGVDPLAEKYYSISPYVYCSNNPVNAFDPDGRLVIFINGMHGGSGGTRDYWDKNGGGFASAVMNHLGDHNALYYDGSMGGANKTYNTFMHSKIFGSREPKNTNAQDRYSNGYANGGGVHARRILERLEPGETIKIISHSMGSAYAKGFVQALIDSGVDPSLILFEADFAPYQPTKQKANSEVKTFQFSHSKDKIAGYKRMEGAEYMDTNNDKKQGHSISSFMDQIKELPEGKYRIENGKIVSY